jgi:signal transduction histidine kinase
VRAGRPLLAARSFTVFFFVLLSVVIYSQGGVRGLGAFVYPLVVLFAGLTWSAPAALGAAVVSAITAIGMALLESRGFLTPLDPSFSAGAAAAVITAAVAMTAVMLYLALRVIRASSEEALAAERRKRELERDLATAHRMESLGQLAGGLAHDFNNMLTGILGHAELLTLKAAADPELARHAQLILGASERAGKLTQQLLTFSRKRKPVLEPVALNQLVRSVVAILERSLDPRIRIVTDLDADPDWLEGDAASLESALLNLAVNARDAMPEGGTLAFRTSREGGSLRLDVQDTGSGIPAPILDKIFEPYFTTKEVGKGTGLGLAAVYGTTQEHGGSIEVESREGSGTTFTMRLPAALDSPSARAALPIRSVGPLSILAVDDEPAVLESLTGMLVGLGHAVCSASTPSQAIQILRENQVDLVILDMVMPEMSGRDVLDRIRMLRTDIPVLLTTGYYGEPVKDFPEGAAVRLLRKPYRQAELARAIAETTPPG